MDNPAINPIVHGERPWPLLVVLSGPSGVGKDAALMRMRELGFPFHFVVTATDRPRRPGEIPGVDYHFLSTAEFQRMIRDGEFLEWAEVYGQLKGIPKAEVREALRSGKDVVMRIDVQGAATIHALAPQAILIFMIPATFDELRGRLQWRRTDSPEQLEQRLETARQELQHIQSFDYVVVNEESRLDEAVGQIRSIIRAEKQRVRPRQVDPAQFL
ncbi:MAG TPA: guanylate kinase [Herpetosiphonaceae bacterium]|jgi:guanylate kinase|nr:guanylate kinase [Herpetosiphonaceae bacterium]